VGTQVRTAGGDTERRDGAPPLGAEARPASPRTASPRTPAARDVTEEHLVALLATAPQLVRHLPARLTPEDFRQPECRELYRTVLRFVESRPQPAPEWPNVGPAAAPARQPEWPRAERPPIEPVGQERGGPGDTPTAVSPSGDDPFRSFLDETLRDYYDAVVHAARRGPPQTDSQVEADLAGVVRRIRERNLREQLVEAQFLLGEASSGEERQALKQQVERLAAQLGRVQLEQSRQSLYTSPS
jgi:hypothetical protein